jgi:acyl-coenzyme A thioesterase PaaI-like protein
MPFASNAIKLNGGDGHVKISKIGQELFFLHLAINKGAFHMIVTDLPFVKFIGIEKSDRNDYLLMLNESPDYLNHLGTVHAAAQFALAESSSGEFLLTMFSEFVDVQVVPVVRRAEVKYCKPATGQLYSRAEYKNEEIDKAKTELNAKGRTMMKVKIIVLDINDNKTMQSEYEWFIQIVK